MSKFAKLFDLDNNEQVLFMLEADDAGRPRFKVITDIDGTEISLGFSISPNSEEPTEATEIELAWFKHDLILDSLTKEDADVWREKLVAYTKENNLYN